MAQVVGHIWFFYISWHSADLSDLEFSDPAILNMSSAQRFPPNYQQQMDQFGYGQYYPQQRGGQAQAAYNPAMMRR